MTNIGFQSEIFLPFSLERLEMAFSWGQSTQTDPVLQRLGFDTSSVSNISNVIAPSSAAALHPMAELEKGVQYLEVEGESIDRREGAQNGFLPSRGFTDDLCYGTGTVYLTALSLGGAYGFFEGIKNIPQGTTSGKLRLNTILNHVTKRGPFLGNNAGVLAITYNCVNGVISLFRGKHDNYSTLAAGFITGAIFKSSKGIRPMGISAALTTGVAGAWCGVKALAN